MHPTRRATPPCGLSTSPPPAAAGWTWCMSWRAVRKVPDWLTEIANSADRAGALPCRVDVVTGAVFDVLLTRSHAANMIVVGSFGPDAPAGMLVGSTALTLI